VIERFFEADAGEARRLRWAWWMLTAFYLSALADLGLGLLRHGESTSRLTLALGAGLVVMTVIVAVTAALLNDARLSRIQAALRSLHWLIGLLLLAGLFGFGLVMRPEFLYAHVGLALAAAAVLILLTVTSADAPKVSRLWLGVIVIAILAVFALRAYGLSDYPNVDIVDEPWNLSKSILYLETGTVSQFTVLGQPGDWSYYTTYYIPRWSIPVGWWMGVTGIGLWQARLFNLLVMVGITALMAAAARNLYGRNAGLFTAAALVASAVFMLDVRVRPDVGLALAIALSIWLYSEALKRQKLWLHLAAGLAIGCGGFAHYHVAIFGPILLLSLYLPRYVAGLRSGRRFPERGVWLFAAGALLGLALFVAIQILPDIQTFLTNRVPRHPADAPQFLEMVGGYLRAVTQVSWYEALLIGFGVLAALWRRRSFDVSLLLLLLLGHLAIPIVTNAVKDHYLVALTPLYGLCVGLLLSETLIGPRRAGWIVLVAGLGVVMPTLGQTLKTPVRSLIAHRPIEAPALPAAQWVLDHVPTGKSILAENDYYLWLYHYPFISTSMSETTPDEIYARYPTRGEFWLSLNAGIIILDPGMSSFGDLRQLLDDRLMQAHGYTQVAKFDNHGQPVLIYEKILSPLTPSRPAAAAEQKDVRHASPQGEG
jgi:hypothetical protein